MFSLIQPNLEEAVSAESLHANRKLRSSVWKEFELTMLDDGTYKAICKHCKKYFVVGNRAGTSHLKYHTGVCPKIQLSKRRKFGSPKLDIPIFGDDTFLMLERAMEFRDAFDRLHECESSYKFLPSNEDEQHIHCVADCLKVFYEVKKDFQVQNIPL